MYLKYICYIYLNSSSGSFDYMKKNIFVYGIVFLLLILGLSGCVDPGVSNEVKNWYNNHYNNVVSLNNKIINDIESEVSSINSLQYMLDYLNKSLSELKEFSNPNDELCIEYLKLYLFDMELSYRYMKLAIEMSMNWDFITYYPTNDERQEFEILKQESSDYSESAIEWRDKAYNEMY